MTTAIHVGAWALAILSGLCVIAIGVRWIADHLSRRNDLNMGAQDD